MVLRRDRKAVLRDDDGGPADRDPWMTPQEGEARIP
jgi:hypothetical protein